MTMTTTAPSIGAMRAELAQIAALVERLGKELAALEAAQSAPRPPASAMSPALLTLSQVSDLCGVSESTARRWIQLPDNPLPTMRILGSRRVLRAELEAWVATQR